MNQHTKPTSATRDEERIEQLAAHAPDHLLAQQERRAGERGVVDANMDAVAEHYEEMAERGANGKGEGQID